MTVAVTVDFHSGIFLHSVLVPEGGEKVKVNAWSVLPVLRINFKDDHNVSC